MKKLIIFRISILFLLFIICCTIVYADTTETSFDQTGSYAEKTDLFNRYFHSNSMVYVGGPVANNSLGSAFQFYLDRVTNISFISSDASVYNFSGEYSYLNYDLVMYGSSRTDIFFPQYYVPDEASEFDRINVSIADGGPFIASYPDYRIAVNRTLEPGTYWLATERGANSNSGDIGLFSNWQYGDSTNLGSIATPEPATMLLFGSGLVCMMFRRRLC